VIDLPRLPHDDCLDRLLSAGKTISDGEYWRLLRTCWQLRENPGFRLPEWRSAFASGRRDRDSLMTQEELFEYQSLSEQLTLWRGGAGDEFVHGLSWTLSEAIACELASGFAIHPGGQPWLAAGTTSREHARALFQKRPDGDREREVVVIPEHVELLDVRWIQFVRPQLPDESVYPAAFIADFASKVGYSDGRARDHERQLRMLLQIKAGDDDVYDCAAEAGIRPSVRPLDD
jgi:hypothetical protein